MRYPETASLIRSARLRKGLSQEKAARRVGCTRLQWINWEKGAHRPTRFIDDLIDVIGVDRDKLAAADDPEDRLPPLDIHLLEQIYLAVGGALALEKAQVRS